MKAIELINVNKKYRKGPRSVPTFREWVNVISGKHLRYKSTNSFYALNKVSFGIDRGEVVGFIGRNGAGKSTVLKLISKVSYPTSGRVVVKGRVAGLLELGAGFHPELTGRENIFFKAAILGMSKNEIREGEKDIINFSGLEEFIDTPIKYYSSGMYARLGFSVAIHVDPDILLIDEVLSVGDAEFRDKCIERVGEFCKSRKKTVVFVSHDFGYVKDLCKKVYWLDHGEIVEAGKPEAVIERYVSASK